MSSFSARSSELCWPLPGVTRIVDIETFVAEEALVARDQKRQVVDRVHHRGFDFFQLGHWQYPSGNVFE